MNNFKRERRYLVLKTKHLTQEHCQKLADIADSVNHPLLECVVVESDWPNYEDTWQAIEQVANGEYQSPYALIERLQNRIAELEAQVPKWVSVDDELPKKDGDYICYRPCQPNQFAIRSFKKDRRLDNNGFSGVYDVSHWMLPQPPKEQDHE